MKKYILRLFLLVITFNLSSQNYIINVCCPGNPLQLDPNTPSDSCGRNINIDYTQLQNIWQVGKVNKTVFTTGSTGPKAIVTDTINPYPVNNLSSFQLTIANCNQSNWCGGGGYVGMILQFAHKYDTENGKDGGTIEVSSDRGGTWFNVINANTIVSNGTVNNFYSNSNTVTSLNKPGFSGSSGGWMTSGFSLNSSMPLDTVLVRFTFGSDSQNSGAGWMIGNMWVAGAGEGIQQYTNFNLINVAPNPANNQLQIKSTTNKPLQGEVSLFDNLGRQVFYNKEFAGGNIDISFLKPGIYMLKYFEDNNYSSVKFIKQ